MFNLWGSAVTVHRGGKPAETLSGQTLAFATSPGETIVLALAGSTPRPITDS
jgi:hypothetical protein